MVHAALLIPGALRSYAGWKGQGEPTDTLAQRQSQQALLLCQIDESCLGLPMILQGQTQQDPGWQL